jgi:Tfp pilus assembly protein PilV
MTVQAVSNHDGARGYLLIELLISAVIMSVVLGVLVQLAIAAHSAVSVQSEAADLQQRLRVAVSRMQHDVALAGAAPVRGAPLLGPLSDHLPPVRPARTGEVRRDPALSFFSDRISLVFAAEAYSQTLLSAAAMAGQSTIFLDANAPGCPRDGVCGLSAGRRVVVFEPGSGSGRHEVFTVAAADATTGSITTAVPLSDAYPAGAGLAPVVQRTYYRDARENRLMVYDGERSDLPLLDHVVDLRFTYYGDSGPGTDVRLMASGEFVDGPALGTGANAFDGDLLRIRRIAVTVRLEAESPAFRSRGVAFLTPGSSQASARAVPDARATFEVALRNVEAP